MLIYRIKPVDTASQCSCFWLAQVRIAEFGGHISGRVS
jgi:hypothetical protein